MRHRNKYNVNLINNPYKKDPALLQQKNALEAQWYDKEADEYFIQLDADGKLTQMDREYEEWFAEFYDNPSDEFIFDKNYNYFNKFPKRRPLRFLELGTGNGALSRFFIRRGVEVVSIDVSLRCLEFLAMSDSNSRPIRSCSEILPFKNDCFDVVTALVALHHFNLRLSLAEMYRVLKKGGVGIFIEPMCNSELYYKLRQLIPIPDAESPGGGGLNKQELVMELENSDFKYSLAEFELITRIERIPLLFRFQNHLKKLDNFILSHLSFLRKFARVIVIEVRKE